MIKNKRTIRHYCHPTTEAIPVKDMIGFLSSLPDGSVYLYSFQDYPGDYQIMAIYNPSFEETREGGIFPKHYWHKDETGNYYPLETRQPWDV